MQGLPNSHLEKPSNHFHQGLYEVHLPVTNLARSIDFYTEKLGFKLSYGGKGKTRALLLYFKGDTRWMLGLFQVDNIMHRQPSEYHISFRIDEDDVDEMISYLERYGIEPVHPPAAPVRGRMREPIVHGWMPAASVFFRDPDGHLLELIADLSDTPRPDFSYRPLSEWRTLYGAKRKVKRTRRMA